jgi:hypothetical protein
MKIWLAIYVSAYATKIVSLTESHVQAHDNLIECWMHEVC